MRPTIHVLIVEDSEDDARWLTQELNRGYDAVCERVESRAALEKALGRRPWDLVLSDYFLPGFGGLEALKLVLDKTPDIPFILVSGKAGEDTAVEAMKAGAHDYVLKHQLARLLPAVERCLKEADIRRAKREAEEALRRGQENLRRANEELEGLVRERTAKLSEANERLSGEIIGRMRAQSQRDLFFSLTHDLLAVGGFDGLIKQVNPAWRKTLGYAPKDLLGKPFLQVVHPEDKPGVEEELGRLAEGRETVAYEVRLLTADGSHRWTSWNVTPFPSEGILVGVGRDITDRRAAEDARARLAAIVESSADAVIAQTLDGAVFNWNVSAQLMYGHTLAEALGRRAVDLLSPENPRELSRLLERVKRGELVRHQEAVHARKDGSRMDVSLSLSPLRDRAGRIIGAAVISRDVTEHKRLREAALHAERLAILGQMAAGVAHELKTPMTVILGFADVLAEEAKETGASTERFDVIAKQVRRCAGLVNNLLDFSRKGTAATEDFDLNEAARNALALIHPLAQAKNVSVAADLDPAPLSIHGRAEALQQVVINLCSNALDAMPNGGALAVLTRRTDGGSCAQLVVSDTGEGMEPDVQDKIFEPFFTTKGQGKGTGLGLWMSHEIVTGHRGRMACASRKGRGTTFTVTLPLKSSSSEAHAAETAAAPADSSDRRKA